MGTAIYCRISSDPNEKEAGVRRQEADCRELAVRHGLDDVTVYVDNDVSASQPMENRPAFMQMLNDAQDGLVSTIIAWRDDRLWRNVDHKSQVFAIARESGVESIITMDQAYKPDNIGDQLVSTMKAAVAEYEAASTKLRVTRALRERAVNGLPHGGVRAFGYQQDKVTIEPKEAALIHEAAKRVLAGEPISRICKDWNERGVPTVNGGIWRPRTLRGMLSNPRYIGKRVHQGEVMGDAAWSAILNEATFKQLQRLFSSRTRGPNADKHLLSGLVYCAGCDHRLAAGSTRGVRLYRTHNQGNVEHTCGFSLSIPAEPVEDFIRDVVIERLSKSVIPSSVVDDRSDDLLVELASVRERLEELNEMWKAGELTRVERANLRQDLVKRVEALEASLSKLVAPGLPDDTPRNREALETAWKDNDTTWKRQVLTALIARIDVKAVNGADGHTCLRCGVDISHKQKLSKYCSSRCNQKAYEERKRKNIDADRIDISQRLGIVWTS